MRSSLNVARPKGGAREGVATDGLKTTSSVTVVTPPGTWIPNCEKIVFLKMDFIPVQLKPITLPNVIETGKKLGSGAYGEVVEVRLSTCRLKCAGKKLHTLFFDQSPREEQRAIVSRFVDECVR